MIVKLGTQLGFGEKLVKTVTNTQTVNVLSRTLKFWDHYDGHATMR